MHAIARACPFVVAALMLTGCSDHSHEHEHSSNTYNGHACDHLEFGPTADVTPGADAASAGEAKVMSDSTVTLAAAGAGYVKFSAAKAGLYGVFTDRDNVTVTVEDAGGKTLSPTTSAVGLPTCENVSVKSKAMYDVGAAGNYFVVLEVAGQQVVHVVIVDPVEGISDK